MSEVHRNAGIERNVRLPAVTTPSRHSAADQQCRLGRRRTAVARQSERPLSSAKIDVREVRNGSTAAEWGAVKLSFDGRGRQRSIQTPSTDVLATGFGAPVPQTAGVV